MLAYILGVTKRITRGLRTGPGFRDCKSGKRGLQIGTSSGISNRGKKFTNRGRDFTQGFQRDLKSRQRLQIGARKITNWTGVSNRGKDYK